MNAGIYRNNFTKHSDQQRRVWADGAGEEHNEKEAQEYKTEEHVLFKRNAEKNVEVCFESIKQAEKRRGGQK